MHVDHVPLNNKLIKKLRVNKKTHKITRQSAMFIKVLNESFLMYKEVISKILTIGDKLLLAQYSNIDGEIPYKR